MPDAVHLWIVILHYNGYADTRACLRSLLKAEKTEEPVNILMVDNGSRDDSPARLQTEFTARVEFLSTSRNLGYAGGNNLGIQCALNAGANLILLLNNDTIVAPDFIATILRAATQQPEVGMWGGKIFYLDAPERIWYAGGEMQTWLGRTRHFGFGQRDCAVLQREREVDFITGCAMLARAEVFAKLGLLDETLFLYYEDVDFCQRAERAGIIMRYLPNAVLRHKVGAGVGKQMTSDYLYYQTRNRYHVLQRGRGLIYKLWLLVLHLVVYTGVRMFLIALHGGPNRLQKMRAIGQGAWDALRRRYGPRLTLA